MTPQFTVHLNINLYQQDSNYPNVRQTKILFYVLLMRAIIIIDLHIIAHRG